MFQKIMLLVFLISTFTKLEAKEMDKTNSLWNYYWDIKAHNKGQVHFSYGYGFPRTETKLLNYYKLQRNFEFKGVGPFMFKAEYGLHRNLSILLSCNYTQYNGSWDKDTFDARWNRNLPFKYGTIIHDISANLRFNYHLLVTPRWDAYVGGGVGYNRMISKDYTTYTPDTAFVSQFKAPFPASFEMTTGIRYFFLNRTAIYLEAGYAKSYVQGGFVFKFRHRKRE